jgi:hypothetical protein
MTVVNFTHKEQIALADLSVTEQCLPAHMMILMHDQAHTKGYQFRPDIVDKLNKAVEAVITTLPQERMVLVAKRIDGLAVSILRDVGASDPVQGFYCCAQFILVLVEEGYLADVDNMAVLVAMLVNTEIEDMGDLLDYKHDRAKVKSTAQNMLVRAQFQGCYTRRLDQKKAIA